MLDSEVYMREIRFVHSEEIIEKVKKMVIDANYNLAEDIYEAVEEAKRTEISETGRDVLQQITKNADIAKYEKKAICQDTGMAVFFVEVGQNVFVKGATLTEAIEEGTRQGYKEGYLRKSIVKDPFIRENTKDNTPCIIHYDIVAGDKIHIFFSPKGFGSENMSKIHMLPPAEGMEGAKKVIIQTIEQAGANACPPMIVGVGIGGNFEKASIMAKKALLRPVGEKSAIHHIQMMEKEVEKEANTLGIGPAGLGGKTTVLAVHILTYATHIAGLPVAINISCHATRHTEITI